MSLYIRRLLAEFVDRELEMEQLLSGRWTNAEFIVFVVWGPGGVGKSSLQGEDVGPTRWPTQGPAEVRGRAGARPATTTCWRWPAQDARRPRAAAVRRPSPRLIDCLHQGAAARAEGDGGGPAVDRGGAGGASFAGSAGPATSAAVMVKDVMLPGAVARAADLGERAAESRLTDAFLEGAAAALGGAAGGDLLRRDREDDRPRPRHGCGASCCPRPATASMGTGESSCSAGGAKPEVDRLLAGGDRGAASCSPLSRDYIHTTTCTAAASRRRDRAGVADVMLLGLTEGNPYHARQRWSTAT